MNKIYNFIIALFPFLLFSCTANKEVPQNVIKYHTQKEVEALFEGYKLPTIDYCNTEELYDNYYVTSFKIRDAADSTAMNNLIKKLLKDKPVQMDYEKGSGVSYKQISGYRGDSIVCTTIILYEYGIDIHPEVVSLIKDDYTKPFISLGCPLPPHKVLYGYEGGVTILFNQPISTEWLTKAKQLIQKEHGWNWYEEDGGDWRGFFTSIVVSNQNGLKTYFSCSNTNKVYTYAEIMY